MGEKTNCLLMSVMMQKGDNARKFMCEEVSVATREVGNKVMSNCFLIVRTFYQNVKRYFISVITPIRARLFVCVCVLHKCGRTMT